MAWHGMAWHDGMSIMLFPNRMVLQSGNLGHKAAKTGANVLKRLTSCPARLSVAWNAV